jgi:hypothetical protein
MKELQWRQPAAYGRAFYREYRQTNPFVNSAYSGWTFALLLILGDMMWFGMHSTPFAWQAYVVCAFIASQVVARFLPLGNPVCYVTVVFSDDGVRTIWHQFACRTVPIEFWPWDRIARCRIALKAIAGKTFPVLVVESWEGREMATFGLNQRPTVAEIAEWLKHVGREVVDETETQSPGGAT